MRRVEGAQLAAHLKAAQIVFVIAEALPGRGALQVLPVHLAAPPVVGGDGRGFKPSAPVQHAGIFLGSCQLRHRYGGQLLPHDLPLRRVIIQKYQAVGQDIDLPGNGVDVAGLWLPVGLEAQEVVCFEHAVRPFKAGLCRGFLIFAAHIQKHAHAGKLF